MATGADDSQRATGHLSRHPSPRKWIARRPIGQLIRYEEAEHGVTHEHAVAGALPGVAYHAPSDHGSFAAVRAFLGELFR